MDTQNQEKEPLSCQAIVAGCVLFFVGLFVIGALVGLAAYYDDPSDGSMTEMVVTWGCLCAASPFLIALALLWAFTWALPGAASAAYLVIPLDRK